MPNFLVLGAQTILNMLWGIIYFPFWWYTRGLVFITAICGRFLSRQEKSLAIMLRIKNLNRPLYENQELLGMLASLWVRIFQIIWRSLIMLFWIIGILIFLYFWIMLPLAAAYGVYIEIS
jgi:hypothetical protein